jgi:tetratricopeptide (TPR) repeat protein
MPPDDVEALNGLGVAYAGAERFRDAIATFRKVLALDPTNGLAHQNIGSMQLREALAAKSDGDRRDLLQAAERSVLQALEADPALPDAHTTLGVILSRTGRKGDAIESWKRAVALDATQFNALYNLWFELASAGRRDEAVVYGRQFVATAPPALFAADIREIRQYLGGV